MSSAPINSSLKGQVLRQQRESQAGQMTQLLFQLNIGTHRTNNEKFSTLVEAFEQNILGADWVQFAAENDGAEWREILDKTGIMDEDAQKLKDFFGKQAQAQVEEEERDTFDEGNADGIFKAAESAAAATKRASGATSGNSRARMSVLSMDAMSRLQSYGAQLNHIEVELDSFEQAISARKAGETPSGESENQRFLKMKGSLAQMHGVLEKLQCVSIDAVMTGPLTSGKSDAKSLRKALTARSEELSQRAAKASTEVKSFTT